MSKSTSPEDVKLITPSDKLYDTLTSMFVDTTITVDNIVRIVPKIMQIVERYPKLSGSGKKDLVIKVLTRYTKDVIDDEDTEQTVTSFITLFLPSVIDTIIAVDKKELTVKLKKCFSCF